MLSCWSAGTTWEKLRKAYGKLQLNRTWIEIDATASAALQRMKDILGAATPYRMIKDVASLILTVEGVNTALHNQCLYPLKTLKSQVEKQASIAHTNQAQLTAVEAADEAFDKIEAASKPKKTPGIGETRPPVYVKKRRVVQAAWLAPKSFLETQEDVDAYLRKLRQAPESSINNDERAEIR